MSRSRNGCQPCRNRKKRCGEEKPICQNCEHRKSRCAYPANVHNNTPAYKILIGSGHYLPLSPKPIIQFVNCVSNEIPKLCPEYEGFETTSKDISGIYPLDLETRLISVGRNHQLKAQDASPFAEKPRDVNIARNPGTLVRLSEDDCQLLEYYYEVICRFRVYEDVVHNRFRTLILPLCIFEGPLLHAVLAMSANDRQWSNGTSTASQYQQLALTHKIQSLQQLHNNLLSESNASEMILTCVILCCLEISTGSRAEWADHISGALAILERWGPAIDSETFQFSYNYLRQRYTLFRTTVEDNPIVNSTTRQQEISGNDINSKSISWLVNNGFPQDLASDNCIIDTHYGCSLEVVDIISSITRLAHERQLHRRSGNSTVSYEYQALHDAYAFQKRLEELNQWGTHATPYLISCAETFRVAALIYLRYTGLNANLEQSYIKNYLNVLLDLLHTIIFPGQKRKLFPVWPLYIAGYFSTRDKERETVLLLFSTLQHIWPVSNIPTVQEAVESVWKARDLQRESSFLNETERAFMWHQVFKLKGWKLALT
ncbi:fungal-specific transcription factor domain-containing protein [Xylogone sp. PMI_703]|nr:fungal-specific transcription factor domain-containing protein [Xylogone sp. PMI_703]